MGSVRRQRAAASEDRVRFVVQTAGDGEAVEIPFRILVVGDFTQRANEEALEDSKPLRVDQDNLNEFMAAQSPCFSGQVLDFLNPENEGGHFEVSLPIDGFGGFRPGAIVEQVPEIRNVLLRRASLADRRSSAQTSSEEAWTLDAEIAEIDRRLAKQVNAVLHHPKFQALESSWRSLKYLVERIDLRQNIRLDVLNVAKRELMDDFEDAPEVAQSGLYRRVYSAEYGTFGGMPYGMICCLYDFEPSAPDIHLLSQCAAVGAMAHSPFIANASPRFFGDDSFERLPEMDLQSLFEGPQYTRWNRFREQEDSRYIGLCMPRFLGRLPYVASMQSVEAFSFEEEIVGTTSFLWNPASVAFAVRAAAAFAKYRWCVNVVGYEAAGAVSRLPKFSYKNVGPSGFRCPTESFLTERREHALASLGFLPLMSSKSVSEADSEIYFASANSVQLPKSFSDTEEGQVSELNYRLGTQFPYLFIVTRVAHYIKVLQREQLGSFKERGELERELNNWIRQFVSDMENAAASVRARKPLRKAEIRVEEVEGQTKWFRCHVLVRPHFKYMGAAFTLSLVGKLDKES